jgi:tRNA threonylcarbamoyladenosine biosynthesis protein TsaE
VNQLREWRGALESEEDTIELARRLAPELVAGDLLILTGGLGAGKTFFTRALCYALGLDEDEPVTSPTFTLAHEYPTTPSLVHADLYRLGDEDEVFELGLDTARADGSLLVVEWGAPFESVLGGDALHLELEVYPRAGYFHGGSPRAQEIISALVDKAQSGEGS